MENFAQELFDTSIKYQNNPKPETARQATPSERAEYFLKNLKSRLLYTAEQGKFELPVLQLEYSKQSVEDLDEYEKLIFGGCVDMGLKTEVRELYEVGIIRESIGFHIYVNWKKE